MEAMRERIIGAVSPYVEIESPDLVEVGWLSPSAAALCPIDWNGGVCMCGGSGSGDGEPELAEAGWLETVGGVLLAAWMLCAHMH